MRIVKIKGKRYRWNLEDVHPALFYGTLILGAIGAMVALWAVMSIIVISAYHIHEIM